MFIIKFLERSTLLQAFWWLGIRRDEMRYQSAHHLCVPLPKGGQVVSEERGGGPEEEERGGVRSPGGHVGQAGEEGNLQEQGGSEEGGKEKQEKAKAEVEARRRRWRWPSVSGG